MISKSQNQQLSKTLRGGAAAVQAAYVTLLPAPQHGLAHSLAIENGERNHCDDLGVKNTVPPEELQDLKETLIRIQMQRSFNRFLKLCCRQRELYSKEQAIKRQSKWQFGLPPWTSWKFFWRKRRGKKCASALSEIMMQQENQVCKRM